MVISYMCSEILSMLGYAMRWLCHVEWELVFCDTDYQRLSRFNAVTQLDSVNAARLSCSHRR